MEAIWLSKKIGNVFWDMSVFVVRRFSPSKRVGERKPVFWKNSPGDVTVEQIQKLLLNPDEKPHVPCKNLHELCVHSC